MNNDQLLAALVRHLTALLPLATSALLLNLALMVLGLAQSANCHLATLATILPIEANRENLIQRLRRWLKTPSLSWERYYRPLASQFLATWPGVELALVMDRTDVNDRVSLLWVGIASRKRVVLLAWGMATRPWCLRATPTSCLPRLARSSASWARWRC